MQKKKSFNAEAGSITQIVEFAENSLNEFGIRKKDYIRTLLTIEEACGSLIEHCAPETADKKDSSDRKLSVTLNRFFGKVTIELSAKGTDYPLAENMSSASAEGLAGEDENLQESIRNILLRSLTDNLKYKHHNGVNFISMTVTGSKKAFLFQTLGAMAAAVVIGVIFSLCVPAETNAFINKAILLRIKTVYMNALKLIVAPVVFFSIISCIVQFTDLKALGRIGGKIAGLYLFTTVAAVGVGIATFSLFGPAHAMGALAKMSDASSITSQTMDVSIPDMIVAIVPSDIITPFQKSDMLQLIFLAVICGIATGLLGKYSQPLTDLFNACNDLFLKITSLIIKLMPVAVFCSIMSMILTMGVKTILSLLELFSLFVLGLIFMMIFYCLLMLIIGRMNPIPFARKYAPVMVQVFSMASSNASIPVNMDFCEKKIGMERKIFSLSIPLGATVNMDGGCIYQAIFALGLARTYGITISSSAMLSLVVSIIILSIGAPGIPGSGLICLSVILTQIGVPVEAVGLVMGIDSLCGMFRCMSNCLGDVVVSAIVAKSEGALDMKKYYE